MLIRATKSQEGMAVNMKAVKESKKRRKGKSEGASMII